MDTFKTIFVAVLLTLIMIPMTVASAMVYTSEPQSTIKSK